MRKEGNDAGILKKIDLVNFMCHKKHTCRLSKAVNFITGNNGSGKSAIVNAIMLCLGSRAKDTHRGSNAGDNVRAGCTASHAQVRVTMYNTGSDAFKP